MSASTSIKQVLRKIIMKFKFEELESCVLPIFPELSWSNIKATLVKNHDSFTVSRAFEIIKAEINKQKISNKTLKERVSILDITEVSRHCQRKIWYTYEFKGSKKSSSVSFEEIEESIMSSYDQQQLQVDVHSVKYNGFIFISIKESPKKKQKTSIMPLYVTLVPREKFFFCARKTVMKSALIAITYALGYTSCKKIKLNGRDIPSLVQLLLARKVATLQPESLEIPLPLEYATPVPSAIGLNFSQEKQREEYGKKYLGDDPPSFEVLTVKSFDQKWNSNNTVEDLPDDLIYTEIEFRSQNVPNFLKSLIKEKVLTTPIPFYAANLLSLGRNELTLKQEN